jgi:hypothetical protein
MNKQIEEAIKEVPLTRGYKAIVDAPDYGFVMQHKWQARVQKKTVYATGRHNKGFTCMHRAIMNAPAHLEVDHINGNGLDNRRCNLRLCNKQQNQWNRRKSEYGSNRFRGVKYRADARLKRKWVAQITYKGKHIHIGVFQTEQQAVIAWNQKAKELYGEFAYQNPTPEGK